MNAKWYMTNKQRYKILPRLKTLGTLYIETGMAWLGRIQGAWPLEVFRILFLERLNEHMIVQNCQPRIKKSSGFKN